jgi:hypothetical protein
MKKVAPQVAEKSLDDPARDVLMRMLGNALAISHELAAQFRERGSVTISVTELPPIIARRYSDGLESN